MGTSMRFIVPIFDYLNTELHCLPTYSHKMPSFMIACIISEDITFYRVFSVVAVAAALVGHKVPTNAIRIEFEADNNK